MEKETLKKGYPYYKQIAENILENINTGKFAPGSKIPTEKELIFQYEISITTVRRAVEELCRQGFLVKHQGRGTYVCEEPFSGNIGIVTPSISSSWEPMISELKKVLRKNNYKLLVYPYKWKDIGEYLEAVDHCSWENSGGIIFPSYYTGGEIIARLKKLQFEKFPFVLIEKNYQPDIKADFVGVDYCDGIRNIVRTIGNKHKKAGIFIDKNSASAEGALSGYREGLKEEGITFNSRLVKNVSMDVESIKKATEEIIKEKPTAVICLCSQVTIFTLRTLIKDGIKVPQQIEVIGAGNLNNILSLGIPVKTLVSPREEIGKKAGEILINKIRNKTKRTRKVFLKPSFLTEDSFSQPESLDLIQI
jgi:GntR family transcriptional regulator, arabinose operon transcriptional repressor